MDIVNGNRYVSIHAPARGRHPPTCRSSPRPGFLSTLPRGGDLQCHHHAPALTLFRSTLPRGERRRRMSRAASCRKEVSIHAPARGATHRLWHQGCAGAFVSIHAPARGATCRPRPRPAFRRSFYPRSRAGSDASVGHRGGGGAGISSSHAPRRGERLNRRRVAASQASSQAFLSTLPRGERHADRSSVICLLACFYPRSRAGSDTRQQSRRTCETPYLGFYPRSRAGSDRAT